MEPFKLDVQAIANTASVALPRCQERSSLFSRFCLDAPLLNPNDVHGRVKGFQFWFYCRIHRTSRESLRNSDSRMLGSRNKAETGTVNAQLC
jgi:hypothetical protein